MTSRVFQPLILTPATGGGAARSRRSEFPDNFIDKRCGRGDAGLRLFSISSEARVHPGGEWRNPFYIRFQIQRRIFERIILETFFETSF
jgi:hypothetical protein